MSTYVLVHGACFGGWCWDKVIPLLKEAGHSVVAPDLPGHGQDRRPIAEITLDAYTGRICEILDSLDESVILVGHSLGGAVITQVAEYRPGKIECLVYLAAFLVPNGQSLAQAAATNMGSLLEADVNLEQGFVTFKEECLKEALFNDCSDEDMRWAKALLVPQAIAPQVAPVSTTAANFGGVPRIYIEALQDRAVTPAFQKEVYTTWPFQQVLTLNAGHLPFFSTPEKLTEQLCAIQALQARV
jgi:pimeloyl-ACP methyl ester carboxylesterase